GAKRRRGGVAQRPCAKLYSAATPMPPFAWFASQTNGYGRPPDKALQRRAWPFWLQPEGNVLNRAPLVVARLART
ncbi:hypothetical protein, partial [Polaromonas sp.]|uniref:hypothetical protein n=1 Tax=Polaromonas sp. TaxID=1869339 RepID=UPI002FC6374C